MKEEIRWARALSFLGLCKRAGRVCSGTDAVLEAVRSNQAKLVLLDEAASEETKKRLQSACESHQAALYLLPEGTIGHAIGQENRMAVSLARDGMTQRLHELLRQAAQETDEQTASNAGV